MYICICLYCHNMGSSYIFIRKLLSTFGKAIKNEATVITFMPHFFNFWYIFYFIQKLLLIFTLTCAFQKLSFNASVQ